MLVRSVRSTCVSARPASRTMKVSASRLTMTPRNFTFDPLGTGRVLMVLSSVRAVPEVWPKAVGVSASARAKAAVSKRVARVLLMLIFKLHLVWGRRRGSAARKTSRSLRGPRARPWPGPKSNLERSNGRVKAAV
jgi:hypothetical protein